MGINRDPQLDQERKVRLQSTQSEVGCLHRTPPQVPGVEAEDVQRFQEETCLPGTTGPVPV